MGRYRPTCMVLNSMMTGQKNIIYDHWLTQILHRDAYKLVVENGFISDSTSKQYQLLRELQSMPVFIYAKVSPTSVTAIQALEGLGFNLVDTNVVFKKPITTTHEIAGNCIMRFASPADKSQVVELAERNFMYSRFHLDNSIPKSVADTIKAGWTKNYFAGKRGDKMAVALVNDTVVGFLLLIYGSNHDLIIDLFAVDKKQRRKGIASDMIAFAESKCPGYSHIMVGTQIANIPSIGLYEKMGFRMFSSQYVFHYHNKNSIF